jgi:probable phosphoglycerate mutase
MTTLYLVRHGAHALIGKVLCGRTDTVPLAPEGVEQAHRLADQFAGRAIKVVQSSPRRRARETAMPIAQRMRLDLDVAEDMDEHDAGEWTGRSFKNLAADSRWSEWNTHRASARPPGGESMLELQVRVVRHLECLRARADKDAIIVTHAEPIRAALLHYRNLPLDRFAAIAIEPGSVSILRAERDTVDTRDINLSALP